MKGKSSSGKKRRKTLNTEFPCVEGLKEAEKYLVYGGTWAGPLMVEGKGCIVKDIKGKEYIDCSSQAWVLNTGYSNEYVIEAAFEQAKKLGHLRGGFNSIPRLMLARKIAELAPGRLKKVSFTNGGAASVESAIKLSLINQPGAQNFITLYNSWHGCSFTTMSASWVPTRTTGTQGFGRKFFPFISERFIRVPNPYCYRCPLGLQYPDCNLMCARIIKLTIEKAAPGPVAGIIIEPIQGNGGQIPCPPEYLKEIRGICDRYNILLIFDEIQTAFGRMGTMFAAEYYQVTPDLMCIAKALGNGFPIGGVVIDERLKVFEPTGEDVYTFGNSPMAQAAALANIEFIQKENLLNRAEKMGKYFTKNFKKLQKEFSEIGDIRGPGLHIGIELVKDPVTKEPADEETSKFYEEALKRGVIFGLAGALHNVIKIKPPLIITEEEADKVIEVFGECLERVFRK